jgi:hypothetical protein
MLRAKAQNYSLTSRSYIMEDDRIWIMEMAKHQPEEAGRNNKRENQVDSIY